MQFALLPRELSPDAVLAELQARRGAANGITARDLVYAITGQIGAAGERRLRDIIHKLRTDGHPICGHPAHGYHWAATPEEVDQTCTFLVGRAMSSLQQASAMKRKALPDMYGQLGLQPPDKNEENPA